MFKLCILVTLVALAAAAPAPVPAPAPAPSLLGPSIVAPGIWGPAVVAGPHVLAGPHVVSVVPAAVSHSAITQVHGLPAPIVLKSVHPAHPLGPWVIG